jgi:hypothetical protein
MQLLRDNLTLWTSDLVEGADGGNLQDEIWEQMWKLRLSICVIGYTWFK